jgi:hypothetical protein
VAGGLIGQTLANRFRVDLAHAGLGSGKHGFSFALPDGLLLCAHAVEVRRSMDQTLLPFSNQAKEIAWRLARVSGRRLVLPELKKSMTAAFRRLPRRLARPNAVVIDHQPRTCI